MATYGPNAGFVPFTGFSPTLGTDAITPQTSGNAQFNGMTQSDSKIARNLFTGSNRVVRRLLNVLIGAASGSTATETKTREVAVQVMNDAQEGGGLIAIETVNLINRATTAADITNLDAIINRTPVPAYVADVSGNGGGGKLGV